MIKSFLKNVPQIDSMLVLSQKNRRYFTGFDSTYGMLVLSKNKSIFLTDTRYFEMAAESVKNAEVRGGTRSQIRSMLVEAVAELGCSKLGFEDNEISVKDFEHYKKLFCDTDVEFVPVGDALLDMRCIKTKEEIEILAQAQNINDLAFEKILKIIRPGISEIDIAVEIEYNLRKLGAEGLSFDTIVSSGTNTSKPHAHPTKKKIALGDPVTMDFGGKLSGYCADMTRTIFVGQPSDEMKAIYQTVLKTQKYAIENVKAGVLGKEVDMYARKILQADGMEEYFTHALGHGIGIDIHEKISLNSNCDIVLTDGMAITIEPGVYKAGIGGVRIEDMLIVKQDGYRNLTKSLKDIIII